MQMNYFENSQQSCAPQIYNGYLKPTIITVKMLLKTNKNVRTQNRYEHIFYDSRLEHCIGLNM